MMSRFLFPAALFLFLFQVTCAKPPVRMPAEEVPRPLPSPVPEFVPRKVYDLNFIPAWEAVLQSLRETNMPLTVRDRDKGILRTDYIKGGEIRRMGKAFSTRYKYNIFLFRESEQRTILNVRCLYEIKERNGQSFRNANDLCLDEVILLEKELYRIIESTLSQAEASSAPGMKAEGKEKASAIPEAPEPKAVPPVSVSSREAHTPPPRAKEGTPISPRPEQKAKAAMPQPKIYLVTRKNANLREGPSTQSNIILTLKTGRKVEKIQESGNWVQVRIWETTTGWIFKDLLREIQP
jgi:hypothetical protein